MGHDRTRKLDLSFRGAIVLGVAGGRHEGLVTMTETVALEPRLVALGNQPSGDGGAIYRRAIVPWLFLLPILLLNAVVVLGPAISSVYYSLTDWSGLGRANFIGLENFRRLFFVDPAFKGAFRNNLVWLAIFLTVPIPWGSLPLRSSRRCAVARSFTGCRCSFRSSCRPSSLPASGAAC